MSDDDELASFLLRSIDDAGPHVDAGAVAAIVGDGWQSPIWLSTSVAYELGESSVNVTDQPQPVELDREAAAFPVESGSLLVYVYEVDP